MFCRPAQATRILYQDKLLTRSFLFTAEAHQVLYIHIPYSFVVMDSTCFSLHDKSQEFEVNSGAGFSFLRFNSVTVLDGWKNSINEKIDKII
jgi:hypothetical protein